MSGGKLGESKKEAPDVFIFENVRRLSRCIHSGVISLFSTVSGGGRFPKRGAENGERRWLLPGLWLILEAFEPGDGTAIGATDAPRQERTMTTKDEVLKILARSQGQYVSGEDLARRLSLSRNAVWRAVKSLRGEGCSIDAATRRGYRLNETPDILSPQAVEKYFSRRAARWDVEVRKSVTSTNAVLKAMAEKGAPEGKILVAAEQTAGKGRMNRRFYSPAGSGVYMSLLLRPSCSASQSLYITTAAAVAVAEAIERVAGGKAQIKWVNDVYLRGKKACGILTEAAFDMETNRLAYAVLGIGVNMRPPAGGFPDELEPIVTSVFGEADYDPEKRNRIVAEIVERFWRFYENLGEKAFLQGYRERSFLTGKDVDVVEGAERRPARALDIDGEFRLHVRYEDGAEEYLQSGEVSVKPRGGTA